MIVWLDDGTNYKKLFVFSDNRVEEDVTLPIADYKNYEFFVNIMGKFNPETIFFKNPVNIKTLDFDRLIRIEADFEKQRREWLKTLQIPPEQE